jgi:N-acyl-D-aspartate/D-glutamate deacylase
MQRAVIDETNEAGGRMFGMSHSKGTSTTMSFATQLPFDRLPEWGDFRRLTLDQQADALRDPGVRKQLVDAAQYGNYGTQQVGGAEPRPPDYDRMFPLLASLPPHPTVASLAAAAGVPPAELMIQMALDRGMQLLFVQTNTPYTEDDLERVMRHPSTVMTFSDAGAHVSQVADASIHTHLLSYWVRQKQRFTLEEAVHMVTQVPADVWGVGDRGVIHEGLAADLNVLDPAELAPEVPELVYDLPGGGRRLIQGARGYRATVVGGSVTFVDGEETGARTGRLLRRRKSGFAA